MDANKRGAVILFFLFALAAHRTCLPQQQPWPADALKIKFSLEGRLSLDSLTKQVHRHSSIRFSFNSVKVKGSTVIFFPKAIYSLPKLLEQIRKATSLYYSYFDGYVIFQDNPPKRQQHPPNKNAAIKKKPAAKNKLSPQNKLPANTSPGKEEKDSIDKRVVVKDTANLKQPALPFTIKNTDKTDTFNNRTITGNKKNTVNANLRSPHNAVQPPGGDGKDNSSMALQYGLLWNVNLPLQGTSNYFTGTNAKSQSCNLLIPGIWAGVAFGKKHELVITARPAQQYFTGNTTLAITHDSVSATDTTQKITGLIKTSGAYAALQYYYHIGDNLVIGAGIQYNQVGSALISRKEYGVHNNLLLYDTTTGIKKSDPDWQLLKSSFIAGRAELAYNFNKIRVGLVIIIPVTNIGVGTGGNIRTLNEQLFLSWDIINKIN